MWCRIQKQYKICKSKMENKGEILKSKQVALACLQEKKLSCRKENYDVLWSLADKGPN